jgi:hypothetical protein
VSTQSLPRARAADVVVAGAASGRPAIRPVEEAEQLARVASAKRELLLRVHHRRLRREDLEDCYSQATLELIAHTRRGGRFENTAHMANALEQRFLSRVHDRRRALSGRSPMQAALEAAMPLDGVEVERVDVADVRAELETLVLLRHELRRLRVLAEELTDDQRLVLVSQLWQIDCRAFCSHHGWSREKYRKVAQRARARLRKLATLEESGVPTGGSGSEEQTGTPYEDISPHS